MNAPYPPHWTVTSCFGAFRTILIHLGSFFALQYSVQNGQTGEKLRAMKSHRNFSQQTQPIRRHWTLNSCVLCVSYYLGAFGTLWLPYNTQCKTGQTGAKVRAMKSRWNFSSEHTRSTPLDPKIMFWSVSYYWGAFGTVWLHNNT